MFQDHTYISNCTSKKDAILQRDTRYMKLYFGKVLGQMQFGNILFQRVKVIRQILSNLPN